jgi:hypothetical protein
MQKTAKKIVMATQMYLIQVTNEIDALDNAGQKYNTGHFNNKII